MRKVFLSVLMAITLTSCGEKTENELIEDEFMNYVQTDFADPSDFVEITSIEPIDTLNNIVALETISSFDAISSILTIRQQEQMADFKQRFKEDNTFIVEYELKVRLERNNRKRIEKFYAIDNGIDISIQNHRLRIDESPELYQEYYKFMSDIIG